LTKLDHILIDHPHQMIKNTNENMKSTCLLNFDKNYELRSNKEKVNNNSCINQKLRFLELQDI